MLYISIFFKSSVEFTKMSLYKSNINKYAFALGTNLGVRQNTKAIILMLFTMYITIMFMIL